MAEAYQAAIDRAQNAMPSLLTVRGLLRKGIAGGHVHACGSIPERRPGRTRSDGVVRLKPWYFGDRSFMTPCGLLLHETDGLLASDLRLGVEGLLEVFPEGPIRDVDPRHLRVLPSVEQWQSAELREAARARGGRPRGPAHTTMRELFSELRACGRLSGDANSMARTLVAAAWENGVEGVPEPRTVAGWVRSWLGEK